VACGSLAEQNQIFSDRFGSELRVEGDNTHDLRGLYTGAMGDIGQEINRKVAVEPLRLLQNGD
jgi:hypothetical protein